MPMTSGTSNASGADDTQVALRHADATDIRISAARHWFDWLMTDQGAQTGYLFRMSREDKLRLKHRAAAAGMTVQGYLEHTALGYPEPIARPSGRPRKAREIQEPFDLSA